MLGLLYIMYYTHASLATCMRTTPAHDQLALQLSSDDFISLTVKLTEA